MDGGEVKRALTKSSFALTEFLDDCASEASRLFYAEELIPNDLRKKVTEQSPHGDAMVECLSKKVELDPSLYATIVKILQKINGSQLVVDKMKKNYGMHGVS